MQKKESYFCEIWFYRGLDNKDDFSGMWLRVVWLSSIDVSKEPGDGGSRFLWNVNVLLPDHVTSRPSDYIFLFI